MAPVGTPVLLVGGGAAPSTRTQAALLLHLASPRANGPFVRLACHAGGHATDAASLLTAARDGTVCLDEVDQLSPSSQRTLLTELRRGALSRLGDAPASGRARVVATAGRPLAERARTHPFLAALAVELGAVTLRVPPMLTLLEGLDTAPEAPSGSLAETVRRHILATLEAAGGNRAEAARRLGISRATLYAKLEALGPQHRAAEGSS